MKKLLLALPLVAGVSWAGTTYYSGAQTEAAYTRLLEQVNALTKDLIVVKSTKYAAGIMESTAVTEVRSATGSGENVHFFLKHQINHSLISVDAENPRFGAASIITTLMVDESYSDSDQQFLKSFESGEPFVATTDVAIDGATTSKITINAVDFAKDGKTLNSSGAIINLATTAAGSANGDMTSDKIIFSDNTAEQVSSSDMFVTFDMSKLENTENPSSFFYDLSFESTVGEFEVVEGNDENVALVDMSVKLDMDKFGTGNKASPLFNILHIEELNPEDIDFANLTYEANLDEVSIVDGADKSGNLSDMSMKINVRKIEDTKAASSMLYDVSLETKTGKFNYAESDDDLVNLADMSAKLTVEKFGNGKKIAEIFSALQSTSLKPEDLNFDDINFDAKLGEMDVVEGTDKKVSTSDITMKFDMNRVGNTEAVSPFFFDLNFEAKVDEVDVVEGGQQQALIEDAHYKVVQDLSSDEPSATISAGVDSMEVEAIPLKSFDADMTLAGFSMTELMANDSLLEALKAGGKPEDILLSDESVEIMRATFKPDTKLTIKLDAESSEGNGNAAADFWFAGNDSDDGYTGMVTVGDLAKSFAGTAVLYVDKSALMLTPLGEMLEHPMAQAYLTITENNVTMNASLEKLILKVNEQVIPLDLMAGDVLERPLETLKTMLKK